MVTTRLSLTEALVQNLLTASAKSLLHTSKQHKVQGKKNYTQIPRGKARTTPFAEMSHCTGHFNHSKKWEPVAIHML